MRCRIQTGIPAVLGAGETASLTCTVTNLGDAFFFSAPPYPVHLSYKWLAPDGSPLPEAGEGLRTMLPCAVCPGETLSCRVGVTAPWASGHYILRITLVQEMVAWFDDVDIANSVSGPVTVSQPAVAAK